MAMGLEISKCYSGVTAATGGSSVLARSILMAGNIAKSVQNILLPVLSVMRLTPANPYPMPVREILPFGRGRL